MTGSTPQPKRDRPDVKLPGSESAGWTVFSYMLAGMIFYGGLGWVIGRWAIHSALCFPIGMLVGLALSIVLVILRFGRA